MASVRRPLRRDQDFPGRRPSRPSAGETTICRRSSAPCSRLFRIANAAGLTRRLWSEAVTGFVWNGRSLIAADVLSFHLGMFEVMDTWKTLGPYMDARERMTVDDIQRAAALISFPPIA